MFDFVEGNITIDPNIWRQSEYTLGENVAQDLIGAARDTEGGGPIPTLFDRVPGLPQLFCGQTAQCTEHVHRRNGRALALSCDDDFSPGLFRPGYRSAGKCGLTAIGHKTHAERIEPAFSHLLADAAILNGRLVIDLRLLGYFQDMLPFDEGEGGSVRAFVPEGRKRYLPAIIHGADPKSVGNSHIIEENFVELGFVRHLADGPDCNARAPHGNDEHGQASVLRDGRIRSGKTEAQVGKLAVGGPDLLTRDYPVFAV